MYTFSYGVDNNQIDVTNIVIEKLVKNNIARIPNNDNTRSHIFTDPIHNVLKYFYINDKRNNTHYKFDWSKIIYVDLKNDKIYDDYVPQKILQIFHEDHNSILSLKTDEDILLEEISEMIKTIQSTTDQINHKMSLLENLYDDVDVSYTFVSGFWNIKNKYSENCSKYVEWFPNTLSLNEPYVFYIDKNDQYMIECFRINLPTIFVDYPIHQFYSNHYYCDHWVEPTHIPSAELGKIWHEKIHMIKLAKDIHAKDKDFYIWVDAGVCSLRENPPAKKKISKRRLLKLPKDKVSYSEYKCINGDHFTGTVIIFPRDVIDTIHHLYYQKLEKFKREGGDWTCGSDQFIYSQILMENPNLFCKISEDYGQNLIKLF